MGDPGRGCAKAKRKVVPSTNPDVKAWRTFTAAAIVFTAVSVALVAWLVLRIGGDQVTTAVDDLAEAAAAGIAAVSCWLAAGRTKARLRRAWTLLGASAASWCLGQLVWSVYEVGLGIAVPVPSAADIGFLAAIPLAIGGILSFSQTSRGTATGARLWLDRLIIALALLFLGWELGLSQVFSSSGETLLPRMVGVAYPLGDILIGTVLLLSIRRATDETRVRLVLLLGGLAANALADSSFAYLNAAGAYGLNGSVLDAGWVIGYLMIALAALAPSAVRDRTAEEKPIDIWQLVLPWLAILAGGVSAVAQALLGHPLDTFATVLAGLVIGLVMVSQVLAQMESLRLLYRSRLAAATLNEVIVNAPLGVVRIASDMTIVQANPSFGALLHETVDELTGTPITRFLSPSEMTRVTGELITLSSAGVAMTEFDTAATRGDGSSLWLHWSATAVRKSSGEVDYFLVMFDDVSARRASEEAAAANFEVLQRLNRVKSQFMTKVRHEFRTALVGIEGFSEYIGESEELDVDEVKAMAHDIYAGATKLDRTLDEMLELDSTEGGRVTLQMEEVDVGGVLREAAALVQMGAANHSIDLDVQAMPKVRADAENLTQLVTSLLGRAIEYSPAGAHIQVTARRVKDEVQVSVANQGRAAASDLEAQLLGRSDRTQAHGPARALGSDVGLPMARQIVEMHGGRFWFETGEATVWHFTIPIALAAAQTPAPR